MPKLSKEVSSIKRRVHSIATQFNFTIVDTFDKLRSEYMLQNHKLWHGHHTAYGNELVCKEILRTLK